MNIELLLLAYAGILLHYLTRAKEILSTVQPYKLNVLQELVGALTSILTTTILVYIKDDIASMYVVTPLGAVILGYAGQSIFNKVVNARITQKAKTKL